MKRIIALSCLVLTAGSVFAGTFQTGDLVVLRVGDGSAALAGSATALFLDEYSLSGALIQSIPLPTAQSGAINSLTIQGTSTSEGFLQRSGDGRFLTLGGYNVAPGTTSPSAGVNGRTIGLINYSGVVDTSTVITAGLTSGTGNQSLRSVWTDTGTRFWASTSAASVGYIGALGACRSRQLT